MAKRFYRDDVVDPMEQHVLLTSADVRAERLAKQLGSLSTDTSRPLMGRRRTRLQSSETLELTYPELIAPEKVRRLALALKGKQPLFDRFTDHNRMEPTTDGITNFLFGGRNGRRSDDPAEQAIITANKKRRPHVIGDKLLHGLFIDYSNARLGRAGLFVAHKQLQANQPVEAKALMYAAWAIEDFGQSLNDTRNRGVLKELGDEELGDHITFIGEAAAEDSVFLVNNPELMHLVYTEQVERAAYWRVRLEAADRVLGSKHLSTQGREDRQLVEQEVQQLLQLVSTNP